VSQSKLFKSLSGIDIRDSIVHERPPSPHSPPSRPFCDPIVNGDNSTITFVVPPVSLLTLDHLEGVKKRAHLHYASEPGTTLVKYETEMWKRIATFMTDLLGYQIGVAFF
jgi:hypothetical protein